MNEIPEPTETGSAGTQQPGIETAVSAAQESPLDGLPIARAVEGLAATRSRSMGGEVAANLIAGSFSQLSYDLQETKQELRSTRQELERTREELSDYKTKAAVLEERVSTSFKGRHLRNLSITVGTFIIYLGIELYRNNIDKYPYILGGLGALLVLLGWFSKEGGPDK
ncbi:hypothetical protein [Candidatus Manganitrophus noduliformans]|uniref:Uncharacterized protein n=1 Tax=Candidatus Manganitrophus noduliformans TaxID=2606439 RepID=A0A7X6IAK2_9BACT|nr:hypothetical protein [Candidatus Manganitrophus noduliformans]NKE70628.1 hypothetical protein [Candidatus Manganitrophus noduliformans]